MVSTDGKIEGTVVPIVYPLKAEIIAPGFDPPTQTVTVAAEDVKFGKVLLEDIKFTNQVTKSLKRGTIVPVAQPLPDLSQAGAPK